MEAGYYYVCVCDTLWECVVAFGEQSVRPAARGGGKLD